mgnify:CR=1 FL=1
MPSWVVHIKGSLEDATRGYELSVIRDDYRLGFDSYGWGCVRKIILFGDGIGKNTLDPRSPERISVAMYAANSLCDAMNRRERIESRSNTEPSEQLTEMRYGDS